MNMCSINNGCIIHYINEDRTSRTDVLKIGYNPTLVSWYPTPKNIKSKINRLQYKNDCSLFLYPANLNLDSANLNF